MTAPDLPGFLLARIADREAEADEWHSILDCARTLGPPGPFPCDCGVPARVLAECAAKRRIVEQYRLTVAEQVLGEPQTVLALAVVLMHLSVAFADHPDYRPEWRPDV